jgi:hypothetical protein
VEESTGSRRAFHTLVGGDVGLGDFDGRKRGQRRSHRDGISAVRAWSDVCHFGIPTKALALCAVSAIAAKWFWGTSVPHSHHHHGRDDHSTD